MNKYALFAFAMLLIVAASLVACKSGKGDSAPPLAQEPTAGQCHEAGLEYPCTLPKPPCTEANCPKPEPAPARG